MDLKYCSYDDPAPDIETLVNYLKSIEPTSINTAYRGQTREFSTLMPSALRDFVDDRVPRPWLEPEARSLPSDLTFLPICYPRDVVEFAAVLLKKHMWPLIPGFEDLRLDQSPFEISADERKLAIHTLRCEGIVVEIPPIVRSLGVPAKNGALDQVIRRLIGDNVAATPFGVIPGLGDFLCQQYGLTSGSLDCTLSVDVAAFFATHEAPEYLGPVSRRGIGVIYRFDIGASTSQQHDTADAPRVLRHSDVFAGLEDHHLTSRAAREAINLFMTDFGAFGERRVDLLKVPVGSIASSRVGRQQSVMLAPRLIWGARNGHEVSHFVWAEDLRTRPGFGAFYFEHKGAPSSHLHRNWLWPGVSDIFKTWLMVWMTGESPVYTATTKDGLWWTLNPTRPDLINCGYEFADGCKSNMNLAVYNRNTPNEQAAGDREARQARIGAIDQATSEIHDCFSQVVLGERVLVKRLADVITAARYTEHAERSAGFLAQNNRLNPLIRLTTEAGGLPSYGKAYLQGWDSVGRRRGPGGSREVHAISGGASRLFG
jgi:hypothetical protein